MRLPLYRAYPWYPGQMGVHGSDVPRGIRAAPTALTLFVDRTHNDASNDHDGTDPEHPNATIQGSITRLIAHQTAQAVNLRGSVIVVGGTGYAETVVVPITAPHNCTLVSSSTNEEWAPTWTSGAAAEDCLELRVPGWTVTGFRFRPHTAAAGILLSHDGATIFSDRTRILGNDFDGLWSGLYGINSSGSPDQVIVAGNRFHELNTAGQLAFAIYVSNTTWANPYLWIVQDNIFTENDNNIGQVPAADRSFNVSLFEGNKFIQGVINPTAIQLDLRGGSRGENTVVSNYFGGDYSQPGGYWAHAANPGSWVGNIAEDVAEPEVADNGFTVAVPSP